MEPSLNGYSIFRWSPQNSLRLLLNSGSTVVMNASLLLLSFSKGCRYRISYFEKTAKHNFHHINISHRQFNT